MVKPHEVPCDARVERQDRHRHPCPSRRRRVEIELDTDPREVTVPADLAAALEGEPDARRFFDGLSFSQKQWYVLPIEQAKKPDTRRQRVTKAVGLLREGRKR